MKNHILRDLAYIAGLFIAGLVVVGVAWLGYHTWWTDTHCTMVLGTQVCQ